MANLEETQTGSFAGIRFAMLTSDIEGGRKDVKKDYPGSDRQLIEDLGLRPRIYNLDLIITSNDDGEGFLQNRDRFTAALESGQSNILVHPMYGSIENIVARSFSLRESFSSFGEARYRVLFEIDDSNGAPIPTQSTQTDLEQLGQNIGLSVNSDFLAGYELPTGSTNFNDAAGKISAIAQFFEDATPTFAVAEDLLDSFASELSNLQQNVIEFVSSPQGLIDSTTSLFSSITNLYNTPEEAFGVLQRMFAFGEDDTPFDINTVSRVQRQNNRNSFNSIMQASSLAEAYTQATQIEYTTVREIDSALNALEVQYQTVLINNTGSITSILGGLNALSVDTMQSISKLRSDVQTFLDNEKISTSRIISARTPETSCRLLSYQYYGTDELGETIADLNETSDVTFIKGDVEILTA